MTQQKPDKNKSKGVFVDCNGIGNPKGTLIENREQELKDIIKGYSPLKFAIKEYGESEELRLSKAELKGIQEERERVLKLIDNEKIKMLKETIMGDCDTCGGNHSSGDCTRYEYLTELKQKISEVKK